MTKAVSPLLGFNNNVKHKGKIFHIQTEDSGVQRPHVITHLFADGGRIVKSQRTDYSEHVGSDDLPQIVRRLMKDQHKAMFIALRDGSLDPLLDLEEQRQGTDLGQERSTGTQASLSAVSVSRPAEPVRRPTPALGTPAHTHSAPPVRYAAPRPAALFEIGGDSEFIFGGGTLSEKSLDDVILSYLAEDLRGAPESR